MSHPPLERQVTGICQILREVSARDAFSVFAYTYSSMGTVLSGRAIANGWPGEDEWFYHYDSAGLLTEITSGSTSLWRRK